MPSWNDPDLLWPDCKCEDKALSDEVMAFAAEITRRNPLVSACALGRIASTGELVIGVGMLTEDWLPHTEDGMTPSEAKGSEKEPLPPLQPPLRVITFPYAVFFG